MPPQNAESKGAEEDDRDHSMQRYEVVSKVGEGAYGVVLKCRDREYGDYVAIKKFKESDDDATVRKTTMREVRLLSQLDHPHIVMLLDAFRRRQKLYLVFEYLEQNLLEVIETHPTGLPPDIVRSFVYQLLLALDKCHSMGIVHRDVKPENMLVTEKPVTFPDAHIGRAMVLKLCDFGFARYLPHLDPDLQQASAAQRRRRDVMTDYVATRWYRAPELLIGSNSYGPYVDVWAAACILGELADGQPLFPGETELDQLHLIAQALGPYPDHLVARFTANLRYRGASLPSRPAPEASLDARYASVLGKRGLDLLKAMLAVDPAKRPTAAQCLQHPYFTRGAGHFTVKDTGVRARALAARLASGGAGKPTSAPGDAPGPGAPTPQLHAAPARPIPPSTLTQRVGGAPQQPHVKSGPSTAAAGPARAPLPRREPTQAAMHLSVPRAAAKVPSPAPNTTQGVAPASSPAPGAPTRAPTLRQGPPAPQSRRASDVGAGTGTNVGVRGIPLPSATPPLPSAAIEDKKGTAAATTTTASTVRVSSSSSSGAALPSPLLSAPIPVLVPVPAPAPATASLVPTQPPPPPGASPTASSAFSPPRSLPPQYHDLALPPRRTPSPAASTATATSAPPATASQHVTAAPRSLAADGSGQALQKAARISSSSSSSSTFSSSSLQPPRHAPTQRSGSRGAPPSPIPPPLPPSRQPTAQLLAQPPIHGHGHGHGHSLLSTSPSPSSYAATTGTVAAGSQGQHAHAHAHAPSPNAPPRAITRRGPASTGGNTGTGPGAGVRQGPSRSRRSSTVGDGAGQQQQHGLAVSHPATHMQSPQLTPHTATTATSGFTNTGTGTATGAHVGARDVNSREGRELSRNEESGFSSLQTPPMHHNRNRTTSRGSMRMHAPHGQSIGVGSDTGVSGTQGSMAELHRHARAQYGGTSGQISTGNHGTRLSISSTVLGGEGMSMGMSGQEGERASFGSNTTTIHTHNPATPANPGIYRHKTGSHSPGGLGNNSTGGSNLVGLQSGSSLAQVLAAANASVNGNAPSGMNANNFNYTSSGYGYQRRKSRGGSGGMIPIQKLTKSHGWT